MKFFLDSAHLPDIREAAQLGILDGVTTNPSLLSKEEADPVAVLREISKVVDGPISAEVVSTEHAGMVEQGVEWRRIAENIVVKIPMSTEGLKAIRTLREQEIPTNCTLVFSPTQALMAAKAGAAMVSPFVGRLDDIQVRGMEVVDEIVQVFSNYEISTEVLVASIRSPVHVADAARIGADISTMPWSVMQALARHPLTDIGIERFFADWQKIQNR
ncbi:MAG: fructose-6-phosphate aldolase [Myxococcales bacterium]|nr:fructose-6-phosphate aldolase [Myxococcales bacterium]